MGFVDPLDSSRVPVTTTYLAEVGRVLRSCGMPTPSDFNSPEKTTLIAQAAVADAAERVWSAHRWEWRIVPRGFLFENKVSVYDLPDDWQEYAAGPVQADTESLQTDDPDAIQVVDFATFIRCIPQALFAAESAEVLKMGLSALSSLNIMQGDERYSGRPKYCTIYGSKMAFYPIPNEDVAAEGWSTAMPVMWFYYGAMPKLEDEDDAIRIPPELLPAVRYFALAMFKQALEYPDFQYDERRAERLLAEKVAQARARSATGSGFILEV